MGFTLSPAVFISEPQTFAETNTNFNSSFWKFLSKQGKKKKKRYFNRCIRLSLKRAELLSTYYKWGLDNKFIYKARSIFDCQKLDEIIPAPGGSTDGRPS